MKHNKVLIISALFLGLFCNNVYSDNVESENASYGVIDAIYHEESRVIIDDRSFNYNSQSDLRNKRGDTILNISSSLQKGSFVKYHFIPAKKPALFLVDLKIISEQELNESLEFNGEQ